MSCEQKREISWFFCIVTLALYNFRIGDTTSVGKLNNLNGFTAYQRKASSVDGWERIEPKNDAKHRHSYSGGRVILRGAPRQTSDNIYPGPQEGRAQSSVLPEKPPIRFTVPTPTQIGNNPALNVTVLTYSWSSGNVSAYRGPLASDVDAGYQADFPGFKGHVVQGKVFGPSFDSPSPHLSEWLAMRPMVQCDGKIMTLTASGRGYTHLLVDREGASPISLSQLPPYCGYSVRTSWRDLVMMAPYDGCYFTQENGSYVLPMLWWGSPFKLSCPVQPHPPAPSLSQSTPSILCSPFGMAVQIHGEEGDIPTLGVKVNGEWAPFVSEECAYRVDSQPDQLIFFSFLNALCVTVRDGVYFLVFLNRREFILSCPVFPPLFPYFPSPPLSPPLSPSVPHYPYTPYPVTFAPTTSPPPPPTPPPPQPPTEGQMPQLPDYLNYLYLGLQYPQLPQIHPPGPQPPRSVTDSPSGHQSQQSMYHMWPGQFFYSPEGRLDYPSPPYQPWMPVQSAKPTPRKDSLPPQVPKLPMGPPQYPSGPYYPQVPNYYLPIIPDPISVAQRPNGAVPPATQSPKLPVGPNKGSFYQYHPHLPYYPSPTAPLVARGPAPPIPPPLPTSPPQPLKQPEGKKYPQYPTDIFYPPGSYNPYFPYGPIYYPQHITEPGPDIQSTSPTTAISSTTATTSTSSTTRRMIPQQPVGPHYPPYPYHPPGSYEPYYYPYGPMYFYPHSPLSAKGEPPSIPQAIQQRSIPLDPSVLTAQATQPSQRPACSPNAHTACSDYPYLLPQYHTPVPLHPTLTSSTTSAPAMTTSATPTSTSVPPTTQPPGTEPETTPSLPSSDTTSSVVSTPTLPPQLRPSLHCLVGRMMVLLPSADPDSIQVRDRGKTGTTWLPLSSVSPLCGYTVHRSKYSRGLIFNSPLPACHSQSRTLTTISLPLRFWDLVQSQYRSLELQCPFEPPPGTPAPGTLTTTHHQARSLTTTTMKTKVNRAFAVAAPKLRNGLPLNISTTQGWTSTSILSRPRVFCSLHQMTVELPPGPISGIVVKDIKGEQTNLQDAPRHCGYSASKGKDGQIILNLPFDSCHMSVEGKEHIIIAVYMTVNGRRGEARLSCPISAPVSSQECNLPSEMRLPCGPRSPSQALCLSLGCCSSRLPPACYYPMDECTVDRHFIFSVPATLMQPPLSPALLFAAGNSTCMPQKVTANYALFKIPLDGCGVRRLEVGKTVIYMVEIINVVQTVSLNYGTITRDSPVRLWVECRYLTGSVVSVGYLVKSPSLGPSIHAQGVFGVQLRIAKDAQYSSYHPHYHQPLQMLLGKPLYLEVRLLNPPDPKVVLLVHYCVAYPRSGQTAWVVLYNGCVNPLDPAPQQSVLPGPPLPSPQGQTRRFSINTFQFLSKGETSVPDEEIYFMCSTEVCSPLDGPCLEGCFGQ